LIEATTTIAVGAVLAGVAVGGALDAINNAQAQAAIADVSSIGQGVLTFYQNNSFFPLYKDGSLTGSGDPFFHQLVSENGTYPTDSVARLPGGLNTWNIPETPQGWTEPNRSGHKPDYSLHDTIEGHLVRNILGNDQSKSYRLQGDFSGDPQRGWNGPYISSLPLTDPWGNKYMINVRELHAGHLLDPQFHSGGGPGNLPKIAVVVISAGPNRTIETSAEQQFDRFSVEGDDIVFRIK